MGVLRCSVAGTIDGYQQTGSKLSRLIERGLGTEADRFAGFAVNRRNGLFFLPLPVMGEVANRFPLSSLSARDARPDSWCPEGPWSPTAAQAESPLLP